MRTTTLCIFVQSKIILPMFLRARGHISLCEILDDTGITLDKPLSLAELYGHFWSYAKGDRFVDLGIPKEYDCNTKSFELDINI